MKAVKIVDKGDASWPDVGCILEELKGELEAGLSGNFECQLSLNIYNVKLESKERHTSVWISVSKSFDSVSREVEQSLVYESRIS